MRSSCVGFPECSLQDALPPLFPGSSVLFLPCCCMFRVVFPQVASVRLLLPPEGPGRCQER